MWKEPLPDQCPPASASEIENFVFRITESDSMSDDDLLPYTRLYPNNSRYKSLCVFFGVSFFDSLERAKAKAAILAQKKVATLGYVQKIQMKKEYGVSEYSQNSGHHNVFFYETFSVENLEVLEVHPC